MDESKPMAPRDEAFWKTYVRHDEEAEAKAGMLEELIDIVLPEAQLTARPIRAQDGGHGEPQRVAELEKMFGTIPAQVRALPLLDERSVLLAGGYAPPVEMLRRVSSGDSGFVEGERLHLLMDGRLVIVRLAGVWNIEDRKLRTSCVIVDVREADRADAVERFPFSTLLSALRSCLEHDFSFLEGKHVPDLAERRSRFDALVRDYGTGLAEFIARLRRVGDSPA